MHSLRVVNFWFASIQELNQHVGEEKGLEGFGLQGLKRIQGVVEKLSTKKRGRILGQRSVRPGYKMRELGEWARCHCRPDSGCRSCPQSLLLWPDPEGLGRGHCQHQSGGTKASPILCARVVAHPRRGGKNLRKLSAVDFLEPELILFRK